MSSEPVSQWINQLQAGDQAAAQPLWEHYCERLVAVARAKLRSAPRRAADEEDVMVSAFASFCRGVEQGKFPQLEDRDNLWRILVVITARKAFHWMRDETRQKRGGGAVLGESAIAPGHGSTLLEPGMARILSEEPPPDFAAQVAEEGERMLAELNDQELEQIALWKMEGYNNEEIADRLNCVTRTVERRLRLIRQIWSEKLDQ